MLSWTLLDGIFCSQEEVKVCNPEDKNVAGCKLEPSDVSPYASYIHESPKINARVCKIVLCFPFWFVFRGLSLFVFFADKLMWTCVSSYLTSRRFRRLGAPVDSEVRQPAYRQSPNGIIIRVFCVMLVCNYLEKDSHSNINIKMVKNAKRPPRLIATVLGQRHS